ncbi:MAG: HSF-type DNA-binding-domain-containing protein [Lentinula lateritia]|nr:MAG: HSF-type DNA-binding-domain-containing protein [Lentinula lateritia]
MDSPYDEHPPHSLPPAHLSHLSRNLSGLSMNPGSSATNATHPHHPDRPFGLRISTSISNPGSHNPSPNAPPSRKRSFTSNPPSLPSLSTTVMVGAGMVSGSATPLLEEDISVRGMDLDLDYDKYDKYHEPKYENALPISASGSRGSITPSGGTSPIEGGGSGSGEEGTVSSTMGHSRMGSVHGSGMLTGMGSMGKPMPTNNFVTKLYQMINDPKSAHFIAWTEHGTSFVVSNVGEFSRSILGSHFKHNNFSSFVRQLNMYGFHKINRTPRAQRTSSDAQTWEFSHHKFLRGRPDLLDEIKRKALLEGQGGISVGPESVRARVELPGEVSVASQLGSMREEYRRVWEVLMAERRKNERLTGLLRSLWDVVGKGFPGSIPPFPVDLVDASPDIGHSSPLIGAGTITNPNVHSTMGGAGSSNGPSSPNIYITSPTATSGPRYQTPISALGHTHSQSNHNSIGHSPFAFTSPGSSPTAPEFGANIHQPFSQGHHHGQLGHQQHPSMSRAHSFHHLQGHAGPYDSSRSGSPIGASGQPHSSITGERGSDMNLEMFDDMSPAGQSGDGMNSASSSSASVNLTGSSCGEGHSPDESSTSGLSARHGDGPGDEPGSQPVTGRGSAKRQRMNVLDTVSSSTHSHEQEMLMNGVFGGMNTNIGSVPSMLGGMNNSQMINVGGMNGSSGSSDSLLSMESGMANMNGHPLNMSLNNASLSPPDNPKRFSTRARSDSAPLYHQQHLSASPSSSSVSPQGWGGVGRPRSGSGLGVLGNPPHGQYGGSHLQRGLTIPSISMPRTGLNGSLSKVNSLVYPDSTTKSK